MPGTTSDRSSTHSPASVVSTPSWAPPRAPLPPHRLAKLANALGVPTPLPAGHSYTVSLASPPWPGSSSSPSFSDHFRRSPTPSAASAQTYTSTASSTKYLLHVIPPSHLPHDSDVADDCDLLSPPSGASGYHTQFRRGVLVPVYSTLSSQLAAIAKEYALPSTAGLILYLILSSGAPRPDIEQEQEEPGPRISEDIWRHIWHRVAKADKEDALSPGPRQLGLGIGGTPGGTSPASASLIQEVVSTSLRPLMSPGRIDVSQPQLPMTPSPSTASHSVFSSQSELETPESMSSVSAGPEGGPDELPLPGLRSPALIPILAKVEFDIDRRKAGWYEPWARSRRAKRSESRVGTWKRSGSRMDGEDESGDGDSRRMPFDLALVERMQDDRPAFLRERDVLAAEGYAQLQDDTSDVEDATARVDAASGDPLADVFGTDEETWAAMQSQRKRQTADPNVVDLALDGEALSALPDDLEDDRAASNDEEEVSELWNSRSRPTLAVSIPSPQSTGKRRSSPTTAGGGKRGPPPPLDLVPVRSEGLAVQNSPGDGSSPGSVRLAYLDAEPVEGVVPVQSVSRARSLEEEKRDGAFFEDLDLGLHVEGDEFDANDPNDRRRSQFIMKQQLDELEKNLVQLSPRRLQTEAFEDSPTRGLYSTTLSPPKRGGSPSRLNLKSSSEPTTAHEGAQWPAVPYSAVSMAEASKTMDTMSSVDKGVSSSPPRIAFNGVSTEPPKGSALPRSRAGTGTISNETLARQRDEDELYPPLMPPAMLTPGLGNADSPIIPLSPDPFGRFPSEAEATRIQEERGGDMYDDGRPGLPRKVSYDPESRVKSQTPSSRFSLDSAISEEESEKSTKGTSLVSMKSIKKLWRKTNSKLSLSGASVLDSGRSSPNDPREVAAGRRMSRTSTKSPQLPEQMGDSPSKLRKRKSSIRSMQFLGDPARQLSPANAMASSSSPYLPPISSSPSPNSSPQLQSAVPAVFPAERNGNARKSILKSWKSANGSLAAQNAQASSSQSTPRSSQELLSDVGMRRRRPSLVDGSTVSGRRGSVLSSGSVTLVDIPPSPALPEEFAQAQMKKRSSQSNLLSGRRQSTRQRLSPSMSSMSTMSSSPPRQNGRLTPGDSPPKGGPLSLSRHSGESTESRPSFDASQFEIVSPKMNSFPLENTLSYPYHGLDHSE
ncbi:hypothetical protein DAEQUDRAFT_762151 [Daedalea quercina L-15889]|uniref:Proteophosphoglycan ppg4 n=1 Tax=Daedalea quercina L-15889 TaxID=1314783 RepID=A0A165TC23_9APHY|nr:hypothetical protein DAEQUDRAFT_762151 [Daedalea quercina L-15889]